MNDVMIDLETLGTTADAAILSIGAVRFDRDTGATDPNTFYASVSIDSNTAIGRRIQEDTLLWWLKQSQEAQDVFFEPKIILEDALVRLSDWIGDNDKVQVWSNGADFDIPMLAHAYHSLDLQAPWRFYNTNCYRTMKKLPVAQLVKKPDNPLAHHALQDALFQALHLCGIFNAMKEREAA